MEVEAGLGRAVAAFGLSVARQRDQQRLTKLIAQAERLPEFDLAPAGERHLSLSVRRKTFAYYLHEHHGDGRVCICCKSTPMQQRDLVAADPDRYYVPAYLGKSGWVSLRLDRPRIDWDQVLAVKSAVSRELEKLRVAGSIGAPLDAEVDDGIDAAQPAQRRCRQQAHEGAFTARWQRIRDARQRFVERPSPVEDGLQDIEGDGARRRHVRRPRRRSAA